MDEIKIIIINAARFSVYYCVENQRIKYIIVRTIENVIDGLAKSFGTALKFLACLEAFFF